MTAEVDPASAGHNLRTAQKRSENLVRALAKHAGIPGGTAVKQFRALGQAFRVPADRLGYDEQYRLAQRAGLAPPQTFEYVLTFAEGAPRGFGYLYHGGHMKTLPHRLSALVQGTVSVMQRYGASHEDAMLFATLFRTAYPRMSVLEPCDADATALLVGVVPASPVRMKLYFNTRLYLDGAHRERVAAMLELCGFAHALPLYDALYEPGGDVSFEGVGVDLAGGPLRVKLYVRLEEHALPAHLERVLPAAKLAHQGLTERCAELLRVCGGEGAEARVEMALSLQRDGEPTLKLTRFYEGGSPPPYEQVQAHLSGLGYNPAPLQDAVRAVSRQMKPPQVQRHAIHGVGIELPAAQPKVNVYLFVPV